MFIFPLIVVACVVVAVVLKQALQILVWNILSAIYFNSFLSKVCSF